MSSNFSIMRFKIPLTIAAACLIGLFFAYYSSQAKEQTTVRLTLMSEVNQLERHAKELDGEILNSSFFLYHDYDRVHHILTEFKATLLRTEQLYDQVAASPAGRIHQLFRAYHQHISEREEVLLRFLTVNSMLKNSAMYIPTLGRQTIRTISQQESSSAASAQSSLPYLTLLADLTSALYLARNSLDPDLLPGLEAPLRQLADHSPPVGVALPLHQALLAHGRVVLESLPLYAELLQASLNDQRGSELLGQLQTSLKQENHAWLTRLNLLSYTFFGAFLSSVALIIALLLKTDRENRALNELSLALSAAATNDRLTGLGNRFAFDTDQSMRQRPLLLLVNIDSFKHINDLYGVKAGDHVLTELAEILKAQLPTDTWAQCYRLGGDDFGLLCEQTPASPPEEWARRILAEVEQASFSYREQPLRVNVSIGISALRPLLETADMALKEIKRQRRTKFLVYREELNLQERIAINLQILQNARRALDADDILVYYQPIIDNLSGEIVKFECLVRLRDLDGRILAPGLFLDVVKESSIYPEITRRVVARSFAEMADQPHGFSINLAIADILDQEVQDYIMSMISRHPDLAARLTFEILESEGMENVEMVQSFIERVKEAGGQIAIDDFGSGYSNFAHILQLKVDSIKIDASLIRNIVEDTQARVMVHTIVDFCRKLGIRTVAEFVDSAAVLEMVKQLGVDYSQGYHLGRPVPPSQAFLKP